MQAMFWAGLVVRDAGHCFAFVPIPRNGHDGLTVGGMSISVETRHNEKVSPIVSRP